MTTFPDLLKPWHDLRFAMWDVETTGVDPEVDQVVQLAVAVFEGGELKSAASTLVDPGRPIPEESTAIHGVTDAVVKGAPDIGDAIAAMIGETYLGTDVYHAAYNAEFDRAFIEPASNGLLGGNELPWLDPLVAIRLIGKFWPGSGRHKLTAVCSRWGIDLENAHDAKADAIAAGRVLFHQQMRQTLGNLTLCEVLRRQEIHREQQQREFDEWLAKQPPREETAHA